MLPDYLAPDLAAVFVGTSVATASAARGHYYAGPGNKFWEFLWQMGLTGDRVLVPEQDATILEYGVGMTDVVKGRASSSDSNLRASDYDIDGFVAKIEKFRPTFVAFNGKEAARRVHRRIVGGADVSLGIAKWQVGPSTVFMLPSSWRASANRKNFAPKATKAEWWRDFGPRLRASGHLPTASFESHGP